MSLLEPSHPKVVGFLLGAVALLLTDLGCAVLYRTLTGESFYYHVVDPERAVNRRYRTRSPIYHHDLLPNVEVQASWGAPYRIATNSLGFKDAAIREVPLQASGPRLLFIGDSFTEGVGLPHETTFVGHVDRHFRRRGVEVLNAAVSSYSPAIYYRKVRHLLDEVGLQVSHVIVFLDISDPGDEAEKYVLDDQGNVVSRKLDRLGLREFLREYSILYSLPRFLKQRRHGEWVRSATANPLLDDPYALWTLERESLERYGERGLQTMEANMDRLAQVLGARGVPLTVVVYPWPTQIAHEDLDSLQVRVWREWSARHGARFIDLFPGFISGDATVNRQTIRDLFIPADIHWNAAGHRRVADLFLEQFSLD